MRISDVKSFLNTPNWTLVNDAIKAFNNFLTSADAEIGEKHAAFIDGGTSKHQRRRNEVQRLLQPLVGRRAAEPQEAGPGVAETLSTQTRHTKLVVGPFQQI